MAEGTEKMFKGDAASIIEMMREMHKPQMFGVDDAMSGIGRDVLILLRPGRDGFEAQSLKPFVDEWRQRPERMKGTTRLDTAGSLIEHVKRFMTDHSALFCNADPANPSVRCIYNFDDAVRGEFGRAHEAQAGWNDHVGVYAMPLSLEWQAWSQVDGEVLGATEFAEFLEDRILDVMAYDAEAAKEPIVQALGGKLAGADTVMALSRGVQVFATNDVQTKINLSSGTATLVAREEHHDGKGEPVRIPNLIRVSLPVFRDSEPVPVFVRLRYRLAGGGQVKWAFIMHDRQKVFDDAVRAEARRIAEATGLPLFFGARA